MNLLLKNGVNINSVNIFGKSALHMAAERGVYIIIMKIFETLKQNFGNIWFLGNERIVTLLVRNGANIDIVDADGLTALEYAVKKSNL